ncbi:hypothetical protein [Halpernia sp. GG3]
MPYSFSKDEPIYKELNLKTTTSDRSVFKNQIKTETRGDLSLMLIDKDSVFTDAYKQRFIDMYFLQYLQN